MPEGNVSGVRKARAKRRGSKAPLYAAIDLGTNNCRLLIARREGERFRVVDSYSQVVRLGEGLAATGRLSEAAMERGYAAFAAIKAKLKYHRVGNIRCIATEACRKAENGAEFIANARQKTGLSFKIISANEEARLAAIGCHDLLEDDAELVMVLDIGGGSTEISFIDLRAVEDRTLPGFINAVPIKAWGSFPLGVVTLTESYHHLSDEAMYEAMLGHARTTLENWNAGKGLHDAMGGANAYMIGTSGTVTCLAGIHLELPRYRRDRVDGMWLETREALDVVARLDRIGREGRVGLPTVGTDRADLMMSGCAILAASCALWPTERIRVADRGLREGLLLSMMHGKARKRARGGRRRRRKNGNKARAVSSVDASASSPDARV